MAGDEDDDDDNNDSNDDNDDNDDKDNNEFLHWKLLPQELNLSRHQMNHFRSWGKCNKVLFLSDVRSLHW